MCYKNKGTETYISNRVILFVGKNTLFNRNFFIESFLVLYPLGFEHLSTRIFSTQRDLTNN
jgi:hypothetical protein